MNLNYLHLIFLNIRLITNIYSKSLETLGVISKTSNKPSTKNSNSVPPNNISEAIKRKKENENIIEDKNKNIQQKENALENQINKK